MVSMLHTSSRVRRASITALGGAILLGLFAGNAPAQQSSADIPRFTNDGKLIRPQGYREWVFVTSGLGMTYGARPSTSQEQDPRFDNVFVSRAAYDSFRQHGTWPDKTVFVLEIRTSHSKGSINRGGHFQGDVDGVEVEVKDSSRFKGNWAFFDFSEGEAAAAPLPPTAACYSCHARNGAVDNTFVQFYPTLLDVAKRKGTFKSESKDE
jgi:Cytochrome P460